MAEERVLSKEIPAVELVMQEGEDPSFNQYGGGWEQVGGTTSSLIWFRGFIDLTGKTVTQEKTFFPVGSIIQESQPWNMFGGEPTIQHVTVYDMVTSQPVTEEEAGMFVWPPAGFIGSMNTWDNCIFGEWRDFVNETTAPPLAGLRLNAASSFGSGEPTITDRLYVTRIVVPTITDGPIGTLVVPNARVVLSGLFDEEVELERIWRQRRSYALQEGRDND